jgi:NAD(P)-dependent dehydrogenase (short-subunit alcohol dehydrogenase family)
MADRKTTLVVGGTSGIGLATAKALAARGEHVVVTSRDDGRAREAAAGIGAGAEGVALDLAEPTTLAGRLAGLGQVDHIVLSAIERDANGVRDYSIERALRLVTLKLVGYTEVVHQLAPRLAPQASIVLLGGLAQARPYPGSTTVSTVNGGVMGLVRTLAVELAPVRVNAIHPGIIDDTPAWSGKTEALEPLRKRTPIGRLCTTSDITGAILFLLDNGGVNGVNLVVDGGVLLT